jgi:hypothetical protein
MSSLFLKLNRGLVVHHLPRVAPAAAPPPPERSALINRGMGAGGR